MQNPELVMKRSQSECFTLQAQIFSPSPVKKASRISSSIARELFDFTSEVEEIKIKPRANTTPNLMSKSTPAKFDSDSSNEWGSDSNCSSFVKECDSPVSFSKNPFYQEHIFEEVSFELPSRSSNPIIHDVTFKHNDKKLFGIAMNTIGRGEIQYF